MRFATLLLLTISMYHLLAATEPPITSLTISPNAENVLATSQAGVDVFHLPALKKTRSIELESANVHAAAFSPDGTKLAIGGGNPSDDGIVEIFEWPSGKTLAKLRAHSDCVSAVAWLGEDGLLSASRDRSVKHWDVSRGEAGKSFLGHSRSITDLCVLPDQTQFVSVGEDQSVRVWDLESGKLVRSMNQHIKPIRAVALSPSGKGIPLLATAADDKTIRFWQPTIGRMVRYIRLPSEPLDIAWNRDGSQLVAACTDGVVRFIDPVNVVVLKEHTVVAGWAYAIVSTGDSRYIVAGSNAELHRIDATR